MYPSLIALALSGFFLAYVLFMLVYRMNEEPDPNVQQTYVILLSLSAVIGLYSRALAYAEVNYDFNPLEGKWDYTVKERTVRST